MQTDTEQMLHAQLLTCQQQLSAQSIEIGRLKEENDRMLVAIKAALKARDDVTDQVVYAGTYFIIAPLRLIMP